MYTFTITQSNKAEVTITQKDPHALISACRSAVRLIPVDTITGMVMTQTTGDSFELEHFDNTIPQLGVPGSKAISGFLKVVDNHPDYEKLRFSPAFKYWRDNLETLDVLSINVAFNELRTTTILFAVRNGLITHEQALHFTGFPIRSIVRL